MKYPIFFGKQSKGFYEFKPEFEDSCEISKELHEELLLGNYSGKQISVDSDGNPILIDPVPPKPTTAYIIEIRNRLLRDSDWSVLPDVPMKDSQRDLWKKYRQELRDLTKQNGFPENFVFPEPPK